MGHPIKRQKIDEEKNVVIEMNDVDDELSMEEVHEEKVLELQLTMATSSINHEYARIEYEGCEDYERKEELLAYMTDCRGKYLNARGELEKYNPLVLETFERDLILQKSTTITHYHA